MRVTYAVIWKEGSGPERPGRLELAAQALVFEGSNGDGPHVSEIDYRDLSDVRIGRSPEERLDGRQTVVLERRDGPAVRISSVAQPGIVAELAERLAAAHLERALTRIAVIVPLAENGVDRARALIAEGPPFDPAEWELEEHAAFVTDSEAVFVFAAETEVLERLAGKSAFWAVNSEWADIVSGAPRLAPATYSWARPIRLQAGVSFDSTPGPGDSDGGDVFAPDAATS